MHQTPPVYALQLLMGAATTVLGGYVAARIARHHETLNGLLASWACIAVGVYSMTSGKGTDPVAVQVLLLLLSPALGALGGWLRQRQHLAPLQLA